MLPYLKKSRFLSLLLISLAFGRSGAARESATPGTNSVAVESPAPASPRTNSPTFEVLGYAVEGNTVLPREKLQVALQDHTGPALTIEQVREALADLQLTYRRLGFATVGVTLPRQQLTNGLVRVLVTEGLLTDILVVGNRYYSSNNIRRALPGLTTNIFLNSKWLQPELDQANANLDRQIYPSVGPGPEPGTTELTLKVKDRFPLHGHLELNNRSTPDSPVLRVDAAAQYNNLWQLDHQFGLQYNYSPETYKRDSTPFYDQPSIASYSSYYRIPFGHGANLREDYDQLPVDFGYDQITHQFRLPPPTGSPDVIFYASRSTSETPIRYGPLGLVTTTTNEVVTTQTAERDLTWNENLGARLTLPMRSFSGVQSSFSGGVDFKYYRAQNLNTNLTYDELFTTDSFGNRSPVPGGTAVIPLDFPSEHALSYLPLSVGWSASRTDAQGFTSFSVNESLFLSALSASDQTVQAVAGSTRAGGNYSTVNLSLSREQRLPRDWSLLLRANGQWASAPLISNEQFALGGVGSVRGYEEGEEYGDSGWRASAETRGPPVSVDLPMPDGLMTVNLRGSVFMDYGERYLIDPPTSRSGSVRMLGTGFSVLANIGLHFEARVTVAWALLDSPGSTAGTTRAYFSVGAQF